ncbi:MAG TPA: EAL domain-containing protein [Acidimicrobiales bacterium]|nr:EAL domain-containing protein [Acidimicrobiales bacterium]
MAAPRAASGGPDATSGSPEDGQRRPDTTSGRADATPARADARSGRAGAGDHDPAAARTDTAAWHLARAAQRPGRPIRTFDRRAWCSNRWTLLSVAILLAGLAASAYGALAWRSYVRGSSARAFSATAGAASAALSNALQRDADLTSTAKTLIEMNPQMSNAQLRSWFATLRRSETFPGNFGMIYVESVPHGDLGAFTSEVVRDPPFGIRPGGGFTPAVGSSGGSYCLARFGVAELPSDITVVLPGLRPLLGTVSRIDFCQVPVDPLLRESAETGQPAAQSLLSLIEQRPRGMPAPASVIPAAFLHGLTVTVDPVYRNGSSLGSPAERERALEGWAVSLYATDQIVEPVLDAVHGGSFMLDFREPSGSIAVLDRLGQVGRHDLSRRFEVEAGGTWLAVFSAPAVTSDTSANLQSLAVGLLGLVVSLLLFLLVRTLSRSAARALELADARSSELRYQAMHDPLTSLPNRTQIWHRTSEMLAEGALRRQHVSVLFVDLDRFKDVNDSFGHAVGDELLRAVAQRFKEALCGVATVGRLGGDEFIVLMPGSRPAAERLAAERLLESLREPFALTSIRGLQVWVSASIGIASGMAVSADDLLREADIALYEAKSLGRSRYVVFEPAMHDALQNRLGLEFDLFSARAEGQLFVEYQPLVDMRRLVVQGAEALLRWRHPIRGVIGPAEFVPLLESSGAIAEVGRFVLIQACIEAARWHTAGHQIEVSVNVSARQLEGDELIDAVHAALEASGMDPRLLVLEITETAMMRDIDRSLIVLDALKGLGVQLAIDDFGTGYSSLSYLQRFAADSIKIDRSFIATLTCSVDGRMLVHTLIQLAKALGLRTIAEGVENGQQLALLRSEGCDLAQGYLFHRPLGGEAMLDLLASNERERSNGAPGGVEQEPGAVPASLHVTTVPFRAAYGVPAAYDAPAACGEGAWSPDAGRRNDSARPVEALPVAGMAG